jgi:hypothetical protein
MPRTKKTATIEAPTAIERVERPLFPYQLETVELMEKAEREQVSIDPLTGFTSNTSGGLLENGVGSGKTAVVLKMIKNHNRPFDRMDTVTIFDYYARTYSTGDPRRLFVDPLGNSLIPPSKSHLVHQYFPIATSLVVCSKTIVSHWKKEADQLLLDCLTFEAPKEVSEEKLTSSLQTFFEKVRDGPSVIVVSSHLFGEFIGGLHHWKNKGGFLVGDKRLHFSPFFHRLVFDDIHSVTKWANPLVRYTGGFIWFVNSTFDLISTTRLENIGFRTGLLPRSYVEEHIIKIKVNVPEQTYTLPPIVEHWAYFRDRTITRRLGDHLPANVQEMLQSGDFTGAYAVMAGITEEGGQLAIPVSARQPIHLLLENKYNREIEDLTRRKGFLTELGHSTQNVDKRIEEIRRQLEALRERIREIVSETVDCPICMDETCREHRAVVKCCNNVFCKTCIGTTILRNGTCPLCRANVGMDGLYSMDEEGRVIDLDYRTMAAAGSQAGVGRQPSTPMEVLRNIVNEKPGGRFLVFAPTEYSSVTYRNFFRGTGITFADMGGSAATIRNHLESFSTGGLNILFMSSRTSNAGLNLQCATDVVIIGAPDHTSTQAIGRVRRFPRTEAVPVHYILKM